MQRVALSLRGVEQVLVGKVGQGDILTIQGIDYSIDQLPIDVPAISTVYGTLLNFEGAYKTLEPKMKEAPYQNPPKAPILYIKPKNTFISNRQAIPLPKEVEQLEVGATLGVVIGKTATKVNESNALDYVAGYTVVNDISIPHDNVHRPAVKEKARDGFCPVGPWIVNKGDVDNPNNLTITVLINGEKKQENNTKNLVRPIEKLLADVTDFMTLHKGDVLLIGVPEAAPIVKADDLVRIEIEQIGALENRVINEKDVIGGGM